MASSVEVRLPYCQPQITQFATTLPAAALISRERGKIALYEAASGLLPESILLRPKQPFTLPIAAMLTAGSPLMEHARGLLEPAELRADGQLDPCAVGNLLQRQAERPNDKTALAVWSLLAYQHWRAYLARFSHQIKSSPTVGKG